MSDHIVRAFTDELSELNSTISRMGGMVEKALVESLASVARRDAVLARKVIAGDHEIDEVQRSVERQIMRLLA